MPEETADVVEIPADVVEIPADSILKTMKKLAGLDVTYDAFDVDVLIHINSAFSTLHQLGVGTKEPFVVSGYEETWTHFFEGKTNIQSVKTYVSTKLKLVFDPPPNGFGISSLEKICTEFEWRLKVAAEDKDT